MKEVKDILYEIYDNYSSVDHSLCLQEDFPKEIKTFLNNNYDLIYYEDFYWNVKTKENFISDFLRGTKLDIHKTEYKKASKEEIENISRFPKGTLIIKNYKNILIIWFKTPFSGGDWYGYIAIRKPNNISDYLKKQNITTEEVHNQIYIEDDKIKNMKDIDVYIPVKAIFYDYKTIRDLEGKNIDKIENNIKNYLNNEFKIKDNVF